MGIGKSFLLSLVAFVGLNFIFSLLYFLIDLGPPGPVFDDLMVTIQNTPLMIFFYLFGSITSIPSQNIDMVIVQPLLPPTELNFLIMGLGFIIAPLIASILAGKFAESKTQGFAGWLLTVIVSAGTTIAIVFIEDILGFTRFHTELLTLYGWVGTDLILIFVLISAVINIIFYGFFALLTSKTEYY
ncbi:MAG: hypothetical protein ACXADU_16265 [Promethearchaeota archaeon]|jgi:hypothetical protein